MMRLLFFFSVLALVSINADAQENRAFSLFSVVTFKNDDCTSNSATMMAGNRNGTCYTSTECTDKGGSASGSCAMGFGTCCIFTKNTCADTIDQNVTYIQNENFPTALTGTSLSSCAYTVKKCSSDICRVRLDFEQFSILGPSDTVETASACRDSFAVSGLATGNGATVVPTICGSNDGQHMYFEIGAAGSDTATLTFTFAATAGSRNYEIRVTQYRCGSLSIPPEGCLQYYTGTEGQVMTFNFAAPAANQAHLENQDYSMCIRREEGMCCVEYQACSDTNSMTISQHAATAAQGATCPDDADWVEINSSGATCSSGGPLNRYCGAIFSPFSAGDANQVVCDCTAPFTIGIHTNAAAGTGDTNSATASNRGLCLTYSQVPC